MIRYLFLILSTLAAQAAGLGVYNPAQHAVNGFMPTQVPGLVLWLDASRQGLADGTSVNNLRDFSGNGFNATNGTGSKQPVFSADIVNGRKAIKFDGVDDFLVCYNVTGLTNKTALCVYSVILSLSNSVADVKTIGCRFGFGDIVNPNALQVFDNTGLLTGEKLAIAVNVKDYGRLGSSGYTFAAGSPFIEYVQFGKSGTSSRQNGKDISLDLSAVVTTSTDSSPSNTGYGADNDLVIGAQYSTKPGVGNNTTARYAEYIVLDKTPTGSQKLQIERYLGTKYGIVVK
jgi:hypothetical protein